MGSQMWRPEPVDFHSVARIRKLPAGPINALECAQWSRLTTLMRGPGLGTPQPNRPTGTLRHSQVTMFATALTSKLAAPTALKASVRARYESHPSPATDPRASPETPDRALD